MNAASETNQAGVYLFQVLSPGVKPTTLTVASQSETEAWEIAYSTLDDQGGHIELIDVV